MNKNKALMVNARQIACSNPFQRLAEQHATDISVGTIKEKLKAEAMSVILSNRLKTPDGTILESLHRHDYVTHTDANGKEYMLDGGATT